MKKHLLASLAGGVVLFVWGFFSWAVLPWHQKTANKFVDEKTVALTLKNNAPKAGVYLLPFSEKDHRAGEAAGFINVLPEGFDMNMGKLMALALLGQAVAAGLVFAALRAAAAGYRKRVGLSALLGLIIGYVSHFPYWNWFGFSSAYVTVVVLDSVVAWTLAGLVLAKFAEEKAPAAR